MKNLYPGDYRTANSIDSHTTPIGIAAGMSGAWATCSIIILYRPCVRGVRGIYYICDD